MSDQALENAKALKMQGNREIERLEAQVRVWRDRIAMADQFIDQWNAFASGDLVNSVDAASRNENKEETSPAAARKVSRNSRKEDVAGAAIEVIRERGAPMSRADLYVALTKRGLTIEGADPEMVLSTMLWRMQDVIVRLPSGGYWPEGDISPEHGYTEEVAREMREKWAAVQHKRQLRRSASGQANKKPQYDPITESILQMGRAKEP